jgi:hypothetical protein
MKPFRRIVGVFALAGFLGFIGLQSVHAHTDSIPHADCQVCHVTHQTPALLNPTVTAAMLLWVGQAERLSIPHPYLQFVFQSHGLAPPSL